MKRKINFNLNVPIDKSWVSASQTRNYMLNDPLIDYLNMYGEQKGYTKNETYSLSKYIMKQGNEFEKKMVEQLKKKFNEDEFIQISSSVLDREKYTEHLHKTVKAMEDGIPCIYQGFIYNPNYRVFGYPDLLIRRDYIHLLGITSESKTGCFYSKKYHYVIVDIKFTTLKLKKDGTIYSSGSSNAYKAQLHIYSMCLNYLQGHKSSPQYILGRNDTIGIIQTTQDEIDKTMKSVFWFRELIEHGNEWNILPTPSRKELYPNMCNEMSDEWNNVKEQISNELGEISNVWYCGIGARENCHSLGITSWRDKRCNTLTMKINNKFSSIIDMMLKMNRDEIKDAFIYDKCYIEEWYNPNQECMYIDFETITNIYNKINNSIIYLIGILHKEDKEWKYQKFLCSSICEDEEKRIITQFVNFLQKKKTPIQLFHYNFTEHKLFDEALIHHGIKTKLNLVWVDLFKIVKNYKLIIKNEMNFKLKTLISCLHGIGKTDLVYDSDVKTGSSSMIACIQEDEKGIDLETSEVIKDIVKYNEYDCRSVLELKKFCISNLRYGK